MPAPINFIPFTDVVYMFEDLEEANEFFGNITVPDATTSTFGVVKKSANVTGLDAFSTGNTDNYVFFESSEGVNSVVPSKASFDTLLATVQDLIAKLRTAGVVNS